jgi:hypothetical protein
MKRHIGYDPQFERPRSFSNRLTLVLYHAGPDLVDNLILHVFFRKKYMPRQKGFIVELMLPLQDT